MDFNLTEEQALFQKSIRDFAAKEVGPLVAVAEATETFPRELLKKAADYGFLKVSLSEEAGGAGDDLMFMSIFMEELSRQCAGIAMPLYAMASMAWGLEKAGSDYHREKYMDRIVNGEVLGSLAITEPDSGSDMMGIKTSARLDGNNYILNGQKMFITNGPVADFVLVVSLIKQEGKPDGFGTFFVDKGTPGFTTSEPIKKMGLKTSQVAALYFDDCKIPTANAWGMGGGGTGGGSGGDKKMGNNASAIHSLMQSIDRARIFIASMALGIAEAAYEPSLEYAKERKAFGKPIGKNQAIQHRLVDMKTRLEVSRLLIYKAAALANERKPYGMEASMAKLYASESAVAVTDHAMQIHGGYGYASELPIERYYRDARLLPIIEGTSEVQNIVIARSLGL